MGISAKGATVATGGGDFDDIPDDIYDARIMDVSDQFTSISPKDRKERVQITVTWELLPTADQIEAGCPEGYTRKQWITLTDKFLDEGLVHEKSHLYALLSVLGDETGELLYDMGQPLDFDSDRWPDARARVVIKHGMRDDGTPGYPRIDSLMAPRKRKQAPARPQPAARPQPVAAGAKAAPAPLRQRMAAPAADWEEA